MLTVAVFKPVDAGVKVTVNVVESEGGIVSGKLMPLTANMAASVPVIVIDPAPSVKLPVPELVIV